MDSNNAFEKEVSFEEEYVLAKQNAVDYKPCIPGPFRRSITHACADAYEGRRSVQGFIKFATAIIKDEEFHFKKYDINGQQLFINSIKNQEIDLEVMKEISSTDPEHVATVKKQQNNLTNMIRGLVEQGVISNGLCKMHFSYETLYDLQMIDNIRIFERRVIRLNTAMLYKQHKFNLLREVSEGFAGLINDLTAASIDNERDSKGKLTPTTMNRIPDFLTIISSRIGVFQLDPNRVLDIILDFFIKQLMINYTFWVTLIKQSGWIQKLMFTDLNGESSANPSAIMAQLIGFRFFNYHDECTPAPKEFYLVIAILLKNGLILLDDILPHMSPHPDAMETEKKEYMSKMNKEITSNSGGKLAMYGALGEEGATEKTKRAPIPSTTSTETEEEAKPVYEANDVVELVKALISVGDLENAQIMLAHYEKLVEMYPQLAYDIYRICNIMLQPAYEAFVSEKTKKLYSHFSEQSYQSRMKSALSTQDDLNPNIPDQIKLKRVLVTDALLNDVQDLDKKERYVFFYKEWREQLELCESVEHLTSRFMPLMKLAGYKTYLATDLIQKLILIVLALVERESEFPGSRKHCMNMLREFLLPAISFSGGNPGTMASVWDILCHFSFQERYALYGEWGTDFYKKNIEAKLLKARVDRSVKYVMRRVSKNDIRRCGRDLGKLAHSNPMIVFNIVLDQVQSFDNMAPLMADACRYLGDFSYDVLGYVLTEKWTGFQGPGKTLKPKEKDDGMPATWLRALAVFTGMLFKKQDIDPTPLLRYLSYRLRNDDSVADLILLNEFVTKIGGIEILASACTDDQITAAGCSDSLKSEAFLPISVDNRKASRRVLNRLKDALRRQSVGYEILVLLYRLEEACLRAKEVYASDRCSKLDRVHQTSLQYFELLTTLFEGDEYNNLIPTVDVLVIDYGLPIDIAMNFNRPKTQFTIANNMNTPVVEGQVWAPLQPLVNTISTLLPDPPVPSMFTSEFYVMFWQLGLYDIHCPVAHYEAAIKRHTETIAQCRDSRSSYCLNNRASVVAKTERQAQASLDILREDLPKHKAHVEKVMSVLNDCKSRWFPSSMQRIALINNILKYCVLPRSRQSEVDATFCFEFMILMHRINTKNFSSLTLFDKVLADYLPTDFLAFSEYEATIHSRFLYKTLSAMGSWHVNEKVFLNYAHGDNLIGFQKNWSSQPADGVAKEDLLSFKDFQRVLHKWHHKTYVNIEQALKSGEAHAIKNAFLVLRQFIPCFPATIEHGNSISAIVKKLADEEARNNIKVLARSYTGLISKYKTGWVSKNKFTGVEETAPVEIKITPSSQADQKSSSKDVATEGEKDDSRRRDHNESLSNKHNTTSSRASSPSKRERVDSSRSRQQSPPSPSFDRKRARDQEPSRAEKSIKLEDSNRHRVSNSAAPTSSRNSPRDTKESTSRVGTPLREPIRTRDPARDGIREAARDTARDSPRKDTTSRVSSSTNNGSSVQDTNRNDDRSSRSTRVASSSAPLESNSSRTDDKRLSTTDIRASAANKGTKRSVDSDRDRDRIDRPEKRRDIRDERPRDDRPRIDARRDDRFRDTRRDDRRMDDRRIDDRRDRDHRSSRRRH